MNPRPINTRTATGDDFPWGRIRWLSSQALDPDAEMTFGVVYIDPGESNPLHYHPNCEEVIFVLAGQCDHRLGDESFALEVGSSLRIPRGVVHKAMNTGWEPVMMVIAYSAPNRETVFLEG
ncbi:cupin domain-containing protein [Candidatus Poribacteria bacterium]|nr:cupin domain-containing protein [Candidatus Poribacteria bacterium]